MRPSVGYIVAVTAHTACVEFSSGPLIGRNLMLPKTVQTSGGLFQIHHGNEVHWREDDEAETCNLSIVDHDFTLHSEVIAGTTGFDFFAPRIDIRYH